MINKLRGLYEEFKNYKQEKLKTISSVNQAHKNSLYYHRLLMADLAHLKIHTFWTRVSFGLRSN